jgi:hypothetical protein
MTMGVTEIDKKHSSAVLNERDESKQPLPTPDQFHRAPEALWMRPADLAAYEHANQANLESQK